MQGLLLERLMTLGMAERQGDLLDEVNRFCEQTLPQNCVFAVLHRERDRLFPDELFADLFSSRGRRSVPPSVVATVMMLQRLEGLSDREAVDLPAEWHLGPSQFYLSLPPAGTLVGLVYFAGFWGWLGQTPGMMRMNLRVVRADDGERIGINRAVVRCTGLALSMLPLFIGLIVAAADPKSQGWHDKIASTVVVTPS